MKQIIFLSVKQCFLIWQCLIQVKKTIVECPDLKGDYSGVLHQLNLAIQIFAEKAVKK